MSAHIYAWVKTANTSKKRVSLHVMSPSTFIDNMACAFNDSSYPDMPKIIGSDYESEKLLKVMAKMFGGEDSKNPYNKLLELLETHGYIELEVES